MTKPSKERVGCCKNPKNWEDYALMSGLDCNSGARVMYKCTKCRKKLSGDYQEYRNTIYEKTGQYVPA